MLDTGGVSGIRDGDATARLHLTALIGALDRKNAIRPFEGHSQRGRLVHVSCDYVEAFGGQASGRV